MDKIAFSERRVHGETTVLVPVSADWERIQKTLTGAMLDAAREISEIFTAQIGRMGYASQDLNRVDGRSGPENGCECGECDHCQEIREDNRMLQKLKSNLRNAEYGILLDLCVWAMSLQDVCYQRAMNPEAVISSYSHALNEWCLLRGWGEQKNI